jgi:sterol desaturase/sphingolipid hydroxylase (fatty acid hydroxylase superfamily)
MVTIVIFFILGLIVWSFVEYALHRWQLHSIYIPVFGPRHARHHARLDLKLGTPTHQPITTISWLSINYLCLVLMGTERGLAFSAGWWIGYIVFELVHWNLHFWPARTAFGRWLRKVHNYHHDARPDSNFGTTSPLWDYLLGTYVEPPPTYKPTIAGRVVE